MSLRWTQNGWEFQPSSDCSIGGSTNSGSSSSSGSGQGTSSSLTLPQNFQNPAFVNNAGQTYSALNQIIQGGGAAGSLGISPEEIGGNATNNTALNPLVAGLTGAESGTLGQIGSLANALPENLSGANSLLQSELAPGFAGGLASSPQTQAAISSAIQPISTQFNTQTVPGLQGQTTQAGQRVGSATGMGSSAFASAFGNAQANELASEGAVAGSIANNAYQTGLNITANAPGQLAALNSSQFSDLNTALQNQELPQMTQQYGINQGLSEYQNQINTIMQALGLDVQGAQPSLGYGSESGSQESSSSTSQGSSSGFGLSVANPFGAIPS